MEFREYYSILTPTLFFRGLKALLEQEKPIGGKDGSIMSDVLWPTSGPENKDEIGEVLITIYFSKDPDYMMLNLPYDGKKDILELEDKAKDIVRQLIDFIDELCYKGYSFFNTIEKLERPFNWYTGNFITGASSLGWVILRNCDDVKKVLPTEKLCYGFEASEIKDSRNRKIGF